MLAAEPNISARQIAARLGISHQRVKQLADAEGLVLTRIPLAPRTPTPVRPPQPRVITGGVAVRINATTAGTIGELLAAADLLARGYQVFAPITRHTGRCDLITLDADGKAERVEVRCGTRSRQAILYNRPDRTKSDRVAVVITGEPVRYAPPFPGDSE